MNAKDKLRKLTLGAKRKFKIKIIEIGEGEGDDKEKFEVRQPTLRERSDLRKKCTNMNEDGIEFNLFEFLIWAVINHTFVPGTDEHVFTEEDYEALSNIPAGGWFDELSEAASELCNVGGSDDAKKPSGKTPKVSLSM